MKKIIATVLAMVMALALCTTAFAANAKYDKVYNEKGDKIGDSTGTYEVTADVDAVSVRGQDNGALAYKTIPALNTLVGTTDKYVVADKSDYDYKLTAAGRADLYVKAYAVVTYTAKATVFTNIGDKCGQINGSTSNTYYTYTDVDGDAHYFQKSDAGTVQLLVDGKLVKVLSTEVTLVDHDWKAASYNKDNTVATFKCKYCDTVATVYDTWAAAEAAGVNTVEKVRIGGVDYVLGYNEASVKPSTGTKPSPKTFDAGIALYAAMALTSVAGSAVVIGKKKEF